MVKGIVDEIKKGAPVELRHLAIHDRTIDNAADWALHMDYMHLDRYMPISISVKGKPHTLYICTNDDLCVFDTSDTPIILDDSGLKSWHKRGRFRDTVHSIDFLIADEAGVAVSLGFGVFVNARISSDDLVFVVVDSSGEYSDLLSGVGRMYRTLCPMGLHVERAFFKLEYRDIPTIFEILGEVAHAGYSLNRQGMEHFEARVNLRVEIDEPIYYQVKQNAMDWAVCDSYEALFSIEVPQINRPIAPRVDYSGLVVWEGARDKIKVLRDIANRYHNLDLDCGESIKISGRDHWLSVETDCFFDGAPLRFVVTSSDGKAVCVGCFLQVWDAYESMAVDREGFSRDYKYFTAAIDELERFGAIEECSVIMEGVYLHPAYRDAGSMSQIFRAVLGDLGEAKLGVIVKSDQAYRESLMTMATEHPMGRMKCRLLLVDLPPEGPTPNADADRLASPC